MSAATIHSTGLGLARGSARVIPFPAVRRTPSCAAVATPPLRLTRRGRLLITVLVAGLVVLVGLTTARTASAGSDPEPVGLVEVTVLPGDTLWSIAGESSTGGDVRDRITEIRELNDLRTSQLLVGQELLVPVG